MKEEDITARSMVQGLKRYARLAAAMPEELQLVRDLTIEQLKSGPKATNKDGWAHIGEHLLHVAPAVFSDPRLAKFGEKLNSENAKIDEAAGEMSHVGPATALVAGGTAIAAYVFVAMAAAAYCTDGPYPAEGESLPAKCVP